jgi:hypothetical protein
VYSCACTVSRAVITFCELLLTASVQSFRRAGASFRGRRGPDLKVQCHNVVAVVVIFVVVIVVVHLQRIVS